MGIVEELTPRKDELINLAVMGVGAGVAGEVTEFITSKLPMDIEPKYVTVGAGYLIYKLGHRFHPLVSAFGAGVLISGIAALAQEYLPFAKGSPVHKATPETLPHEFKPADIILAEKYAFGGR